MGSVHVHAAPAWFTCAACVRCWPPQRHCCSAGRRRFPSARVSLTGLRGPYSAPPTSFVTTCGWRLPRLDGDPDGADDRVRLEIAPAGRDRLRHAASGVILVAAPRRRHAAVSEHDLNIPLLLPGPGRAGAGAAAGPPPSLPHGTKLIHNPADMRTSLRAISFRSHLRLREFPGNRSFNQLSVIGGQEKGQWQ